MRLSGRPSTPCSSSSRMLRGYAGARSDTGLLFGLGKRAYDDSARQWDFERMPTMALGRGHLRLSGFCRAGAGSQRRLGLARAPGLVSDTAECDLIAGYCDRHESEGIRSAVTHLAIGLTTRGRRR